MNETVMPRRLFPHPLLSLVIGILWLLLVGSMALAHLLLAAVLAWLLPWVCQHFWIYPVRIRGWLPLVRYAFVVLWDITLSNVTAARLVLGPVKKLRPAFFSVPLDLTNPIAITVLANTITLTPGTVSANIAQDRSHILVHGLHVPDVELAIDTIKRRYEAPLKEIF
jgi:multicomponent K+:H+ antiporter subunit E